MLEKFSAENDVGVSGDAYQCCAVLPTKYRFWKKKDTFFKQQLCKYSTVKCILLHTRAHVCAPIHTHARAHAHTYPPTHTYVHTHASAHVLKRSNTLLSACAQASCSLIELTAEYSWSQIRQHLCVCNKWVHMNNRRIRKSIYVPSWLKTSCLRCVNAMLKSICTT